MPILTTKSEFTIKAPPRELDTTILEESTGRRLDNTNDIYTCDKVEPPTRELDMKVLEESDAKRKEAAEQYKNNVEFLNIFKK